MVCLFRCLEVNMTLLPFSDLHSLFMTADQYGDSINTPSRRSMRSASAKNQCLVEKPESSNQGLGRPNSTCISGGLGPGRW